ncbi:MAG: hypothetical protein ACI9GW_001607 [Halieaceae bacterium]|jgi:hypothetical protein
MPDSGVLHLWKNPQPEDIYPHVNDFLKALPGPTVIEIDGLDSTRSRALVTLLHGNEPSGLDAVHQLLLKGMTPAVNVSVVLGSVHAAVAAPLLYHRMLPGDRDLNRCFRPPYLDGQGILAAAIGEYLLELGPEAIVDLHNTSGSSPAFGVTVEDTDEVKAITGLFVDRLIVTELRLGSLMEQDFGAPVVTIEAGGGADEAAQGIALAGVGRYFSQVDLWSEVCEVQVIRNSRRLELVPHSRIEYAHKVLHDRDVTLRADIDDFNYKLAPRGEALGWLGEEGFGHLKVGGEPGSAQVEEFFLESEGKLCPRADMQIFMATTRADIAVSDCLFYFVMTD